MGELIDKRERQQKQEKTEKIKKMYKFRLRNRLKQQMLDKRKQIKYQKEQENKERVELEGIIAQVQKEKQLESLKHLKEYVTVY